MTRKQLEAFDPAKLAKGRSAVFEVRNPKTHYGEHHYFYRDSDGELFTMVAHRRDTCELARKDWQKLKRAKVEKLKQLELSSVTDDLFCSVHQCETHLVDDEDGSHYVCPECQREIGDALGLV
jgi:hypothetical protein